jgi:MFS transporter, NRE family, putaive nickel resistance protein
LKAIAIFNSLRQKDFAKLYAAQTISLLGDAFTWVGIALLAFEFGGDNSSAILSTALTLRVTAFIVFAPYAGVLADKVNRRKILLVADFSRMALVGLLAFVTAQWQVYLVIFLLNIFSAFFTPAFKASIPQMLKDKEMFAPGIALSNATYQLLGIMGPGIAGIAAAWLGTRQIFLADALTFILSALFVLTISRFKFSLAQDPEKKVSISTWKDISTGTVLLFKDRIIRFALLVELSAAIVGANILVNTVGYVKGTLGLDNKHYGWVMSALGIGAAVGAFGAALLDKSKTRKWTLIIGGFVVCLAVLPANHASFYLLIFLWLIAGFGQNLAEMPSQMLIAERIPLELQGRMYGAHFAWSHLWWAIGYPLAGFAGSRFRNISFIIAGCIASGLLIIVLATHLSQKRINEK